MISLIYILIINSEHPRNLYDAFLFRSRRAAGPRAPASWATGWSSPRTASRRCAGSSSPTARCSPSAARARRRSTSSSSPQGASASTRLPDEGIEREEMMLNDAGGTLTKVQTEVGKNFMIKVEIKVLSG